MTEPVVEPVVAAEPAVEPAAAPASWYGEADELTTGWLQNKGWDGEDGGTKALQSYRSLEQRMGDPNQYLKIPTDMENTNEVAEYRAKLGVPDTVEGYGFDAPVDDQMTANILSKAHELGLSVDQMKGIYESMNIEATAVNDASDAEFNATSEAEMGRWETEQGSAIDQNMDFVKSAVKEFGIDEDKANALEKAFGTYDAMNFLQEIGSKIGEHGSTGLGADGGGAGDFVMSPAQAKSAIADKNLDPNFVQASLDPSNPGHKAARAELMRLTKLAHGEGRVV